GCAARVGSYRGFVFACLGPTSVTLEEHLGVATGLIDRACDLSPEGEVQLTAGWVKHRCSSNWKMLPENDLDGYHLGFVHMALFKSVRTQYNRFTGDEKSVKGVVRLGQRPHRDRLVARLRRPLRVVRNRGVRRRGTLRGGAPGARRRRRHGAASLRGPAARADLPQPVPRRDEHRRRGAGGGRGERPL